MTNHLTPTDIRRENTILVSRKNANHYDLLVSKTVVTKYSITSRETGSRIKCTTTNFFVDEVQNLERIEPNAPPFPW
jgi:hypothetical protein